MAVEFDKAVQAFAKVLNMPEADTRIVIDNLNPAKQTTTFFTETMQRLPIIKITKSTPSSLMTYNIQKYKQGQMEENIIFSEAYGKGSFGKTFISTDKTRAYKLISKEYDVRKPNLVENQTRTILLEAWIQTVLSTDPFYGMYISPVTGIYREYTPDKFYFKLFIQMPALYKNLLDNIKERVKHDDNSVEYVTLHRTLKAIAEALAYFKTHYGFHHRDLHMKNIMFKDKRMSVPMLIDFGKSCMTYNGVVYFAPNENVHNGCTSNDLLILFMSMLDVHFGIAQNGGRFFNKVVIRFLEEAMLIADKTTSVYHLLNHKFNTFRSLFHAVYPNELMPGEAVYEYLVSKNAFPLPNIETPEMFLTFMENFDKVQIEILETPAIRAKYGPRATENIIRRLRKSTMQYRHPLIRQQGTRHLTARNLIGGRRTRRRRTLRNKN